MTIGAGHAAATDRDRLQFGAEAAEQRAPVAVGRGLGGLLGAVGKQIPGLGLLAIHRFDFRGGQGICRKREQPLLGQQHLEVATGGAQRLHILIPVAEHQGGIHPDHGDAKGRDLVEELGTVGRGAGEGTQEPLHVLRLAVGLERQQIGLIAQLAGESHQVTHHGGIVIAGEGILHYEYHFGTLLWAHGLEARQIEVAGAVIAQGVGQGRYREQRHIHHADALLGRLLGPLLLQEEVDQLRRLGQQRRIALDGADEVILGTTQIAAVIELHEAGAEIGHIHLDGALAGASLARETPFHRLHHLVGEVILATGAGHRIAELVDDGLDAQSAALQRHLLSERIEALLRQLAQPFAHQARPAFRRVAPVLADLDRGAHGGVGLEGEAEAVAVAVHGAGVACPHRNRDLAVELAALGAVYRHQLGAAAIRYTNFAGVDAVVGVEGPLHPLQLLPQLAEEGGAVLGAETLAVLAPHQAAIFGGERHHLIRDAAQQHLLLGVAQVQCRAHVQHTRIDVAEHAVVEAMAIEQGAKLHDEVGEGFRRHCGIFGEGHRLLAPLGVAEQPHRFLAHAVDGLDARQVAAHLIADDAGLAARQQPIDAPAQLRHLGLVFALVGVGKLDDVEPLQILAGHVLNKRLDRVPDDIGASQPQHPGVHRLHRQGVGLHHEGGIPEGRGEAVVLDVDQGAIARNGRDIESGLGDEAEGAFRAA
ncbi:hypothetical protein D3C84_335790 [compost metagenome]